jgi:hypothetical protein
MLAYRIRIQPQPSCRLAEVSFVPVYRCDRLPLLGQMRFRELRFGQSFEDTIDNSGKTSSRLIGTDHSVTL